MATSLALKKMLDKAHWVCLKCGEQFGKHKTNMSTWHNGRCNICNKMTVVTEFRDFGYSKFSKETTRSWGDLI
jgi:hypothetical protein